MGVSLAEYVSRETPADLTHQVSSILDFLSEVLSAQASAHESLSPAGLDGLASTCLLLSLVCWEAAERPGFPLSRE